MKIGRWLQTHKRFVWIVVALLGLGAAATAVALWMEPGDYPFAIKVVAGVWVVALLLYLALRIERSQHVMGSRTRRHKNGPKQLPHAFVSYVRENEEEVDRLCGALLAAGIEVWRDKDDIHPGMLWKDAIRNAISEGDFFVACFSVEYNSKHKTYMNTEIELAIDELRRRGRNQSWFIPVVLSGEVPDWEIGGGKTLRDLQRVDLCESNWDEGISEILFVVGRATL